MIKEKDLSKNKDEPWKDPKVANITANYAAILGHLLQAKDESIKNHVYALRQLDNQLFKMKLGIDLKIRTKRIEVQG